MKTKTALEKGFNFRVVFDKTNVKFLVRSIEAAYKLVKHIQKDERHQHKTFRLERLT